MPEENMGVVSATGEVFKTFISYAWPVVSEGDPVDHGEWVLQLAQRLEADGFPVLLDQLDLKEGDDKYEYMERSVTDPEVKKVLLICTKRYKERADKREKGVGAESTIMSSEVYKKTDEKKFIPVIREKDEFGEAYTPAFISSAIYVDLSDDTKFEENYERLKNVLLNRPLVKRGTLGKIPDYLLKEEAPARASSMKKHAAQSAYMTGRPTAFGQAQDYFETLASEMIASTQGSREDINAVKLGERHLKDIESFLPVRDEFIEFIQALLRYAPAEVTGQLLAEYFDRCASLAGSRDNFYQGAQILLYEQFLHMARVLMAAEKFTDLNVVLSKTYSNPDGDPRLTLRLYEVFRPRDPNSTFAIKSFASRENQNWISPITAFLRQRMVDESQCLSLVEADVILYLRTAFMGELTRYLGWWPESVPYLEYRLMSRSDTALQFVGKMRSRHYFERFKVVLAVESVEDFKRRIEEAEVMSHLKNIDFSTVASMP